MADRVILSSFRRLGTAASIGVIALLLIAFTASTNADETCDMSAQTSDGSGSGFFRMTASTTQSGCGSNREVQVEAWILGYTNTCSGFSVNGHCVDNQTAGNAVTTVSVTGSGLCGDTTGKSNHSWIEPNVGFGSVEANRTQLLSSTRRCEDCVPVAGSNDTCYWDDQSPIIISTDPGTPYTLTSADNGVLFDIDGDGTLDKIAWTVSNVEIAFLAIDRDGDGRITSGKELFGNHTLPEATNGFRALQLMAMATNGGIRRGTVSSDDPIFDRLLLWTDRDHDGISMPDELVKAKDKLAAIGLSYQVTGRKDVHGNKFRFKGWTHVRTAPGKNEAQSADEDRVRRRQIYDVYFAAAK